MYASLKSCKCDLNIKVLNRMSPLALYVSRDSSFISTQFFVLNLDAWFVVWSKKLLFFEILLLSYYINLRSLIICFLFSGDIYLSLSSPIFSPSFVTISELLCGKVFETFVILSAILSPIKSPVAFAGFWIVLFEAVLSASAANVLAWSRSF